MDQFRRLARVVLSSGVLAGLVLFLVQQMALVPLIEAAETYEKALHEGVSGTADEVGQVAEVDDAHGWRPDDGWQRTSSTAIATVLTGIAFAAILFSSMALSGRPIDARVGALWGMAAFACFNLAPALGLPPQPPGVAVAGVYERQMWWMGTVVATAAGLWLLLGRGRGGTSRLAGAICLLLPHVIGAPIAAGSNAVPAHLVRQFTIASIATAGMFWLLLGTIGGLIHGLDKIDRLDGLDRLDRLDRVE